MGDIEEVKPEKIQVMSRDAGLPGGSDSEESACNAGARGPIPGSGRRGQQRKRWLDGIADSTDMSVSTLWETVKTEQAGVQWSMGSQSRTQLSD